MLHYLKNYPISLLLIAVICYLSFFTPPKTDMEEIPGIDKLVHTCMYGGLCLVIWFEYLRHHRTISRQKMLIGGIIAPTAMSGLIELGQAYCTTGRSGDWSDFLANTLGVLLATAIGYYGLRPYFRQRRK